MKMARQAQKASRELRIRRLYRRRGERGRRLQRELQRELVGGGRRSMSMKDFSMLRLVGCVCCLFQSM
jgi:hypothetical protein